MPKPTAKKSPALMSCVNVCSMFILYIFSVPSVNVALNLFDSNISIVVSFPVVSRKLFWSTYNMACLNLPGTPVPFSNLIIDVNFIFCPIVKLYVTGFGVFNLFEFFGF